MKYKIEFYRDRKKEWRWRLIAKNGRILADSGEGYKRRGTCTKFARDIVLKVNWESTDFTTKLYKERK